MRGIDNGSGRKAAAGPSHHGDALPQLEVVYSGPELDDLSRSFEPRRERKSGLDLVLAGYNEVVGEVDTGCPERDADLAGSGRRQFNACGDEALRLPKHRTLDCPRMARRFLLQHSLRDHRPYVWFVESLVRAVCACSGTPEITRGRNAVIESVVLVAANRQARPHRFFE